MVAVKRYKSTALTIVVVALIVIFGVGYIVDPDSSTGGRFLGVVLLAAGAASGVGLWSLATKKLTTGAAQVLIVIGLIGAGAYAIDAMVEEFAYFVWVYGPLLVLALLALWLGVAKRGLQAELGG